MREVTLKPWYLTALLEKNPLKASMDVSCMGFALQGHLCRQSSHQVVAASSQPPRASVPSTSRGKAPPSHSGACGRPAENAVGSSEHPSSEGKKTHNLLSRWLTWRCWIAGRSPQSGGDRGSQCWRG